MRKNFPQKSFGTWAHNSSPIRVRFESVRKPSVWKLATSQHKRVYRYLSGGTSYKRTSGPLRSHSNPRAAKGQESGREFQVQAAKSVSNCTVRPKRMCNSDWVFDGSGDRDSFT